MYVKLKCKKCGASYESRITLHIQILEIINIHLREHKGCTEKNIDLHIDGNFAS